MPNNVIAFFPRPSRALALCRALKGEFREPFVISLRDCSVQPDLVNVVVELWQKSCLLCAPSVVYRMLVERMKKENQFDPNLSRSNSRYAWDEDDDMSVIEEIEDDNWCVVSEDEAQETKDMQPKANAWFEEGTEEESSNIVLEKLKELGFPSVRDMFPPSVKNPKNALLMLHLLVGLFVVIHLAWDRYSWRNSAMHLEQELRHFKAVPPPISLPKAQEDMTWLEEKPDNVIFDNCWVHARASVSFRECAEDARDTVKEVTTEVVETAKTFAKHTWKAAKKFQKHATAAAAAAAERRRSRPY